MAFVFGSDDKRGKINVKINVEWSSIKRDDPDATAKAVEDGTPERVQIYHLQLTLLTAISAYLSVLYNKEVISLL